MNRRQKHYDVSAVLVFVSCTWWLDAVWLAEIFDGPSNPASWYVNVGTVKLRHLVTCVGATSYLLGASSVSEGKLMWWEGRQQLRDLTMNRRTPTPCRLVEIGHQLGDIKGSLFMINRCVILNLCQLSPRGVDRNLIWRACTWISWGWKRLACGSVCDDWSGSSQAIVVDYYDTAVDVFRYNNLKVMAVCWAADILTSEILLSHLYIIIFSLVFSIVTLLRWTTASYTGYSFALPCLFLFLH